MKFCIGLMMIATVFVFWIIFLFGDDFSLKEKILGGIFFEIVIALIVFGAYIMLD